MEGTRMAVAFTFDVLPRTPRYVLQLKCPIFTYFSMLVTMATKYQKDILGEGILECLYSFFLIDKDTRML